MRKLLSIFALSLVYITIAFGQAAVDIPLLADDGSTPTPIQIALGLDLTATNGIDPALGEAALPPLAPGLDVRFDLAPYGTNVSTYKDYRAPGTPPPGAFPFTGTIQHTVILQHSNVGLAITIEYDLPTGAAMSITDQIGGSFLTLGPFTGIGIATIPGSYLDVFTKAFLIMDYTNIGPSGPAPIFGITPAAPLNFGSVGVGSSSMLPVTVSNTGTADLVVSDLTSSNAQFTFIPNTFPITIIPAGTQVFNVTFTPTSGGLKTGNLTFTHNAAGSPTSYAVQGTGVEIIQPNTPPGGVVLVNVGTGSTTNTDITVTNNGSVPLDVTGSITELPNWDIMAPATATIPAGGSHIFTIIFMAPALPGSYPATLTFSAPGAPSSTVDLNASVVSIAGLIFVSDTVYNYEDASYTEEMQLIANTGFLHALQFRLLTNVAVDDNTILTFQSIQKGSDIAGSNWILQTNVVRGPITANGASEDTVYVLLYNINQAGDLGEPDYYHMFNVTYRVARLQPLQNDIKSSFTIFNAEASTFTGSPIVITSSRDELVVIAQAGRGGYGDVNGDGCVDILDLIMVVDHIVGRDSLTGAEFTRADIAPWTAPDLEPLPDGVVNVQDLSLIQNIILTGFYPNGQPVASCGYLSKGDGAVDAIVTLYINSEGITAYVDAEIGIRGAQIEFGSVSSNPENMVISTPLGQGYYLRVNELLRTLMYDQNGQQFIDAGVNNFMADMPFSLTDAQNVKVAKIVLVDINTKKLGNIEIREIYGTPTLPLDYILFQNYPNPFNPSTSVKFQVPKTSDVKITIYDMLGQEVKTLFAGEVMRGNYTVNWDGFNNSGAKVVSGTYIYRMTAGEFVQSKKMILIK